MRRRGFTLIEIMAIIVVLAMMAAIALPSLSSFIKSQHRRQYLHSLELLPMQARQEAVRTGQNVDLVSDDQGGFQIQRATTDTADAQVIKRLEPVDGISAQTYRAGTEEVGAGDWLIRFYPDGTSQSGGVVLQESGDSWYLQIDGKRATGKVARGDLPEANADRWQAGDYVRR